MRQYVQIQIPFSIKKTVFLNDFRFKLMVIPIALFFMFYQPAMYDVSNMSMEYLWNKEVKTEGTITKVTNTLYETFDIPITHYIYSYYCENGTFFEGYCYGKGCGERVFHYGDKVTVEYIRSKPYISCVEDRDTYFFNDDAFLIFIAILAFFGLLVSTIHSKLQLFKHIEQGIVTEAHSDENFKERLRFLEEERKTSYVFVERRTGRNFNVFFPKIGNKKVLDSKTEVIVYKEKDPTISYFIDTFHPKLRDFIYCEFERKTAISYTKYNSNS